MNSKVTYHQQVSYCGKPRCRKCREGTGHGPYWYAYKTVDGRTTRTYVGKYLPPEVEAEMVGNLEPPSVDESDREQSVIRIYVLGQFRLERRNSRESREWQTVTDASWQHQRVRALLGCLVSVEGRKLAREQLMDALWPDLDIETAGSRLDRAVYSLRQLFEPSRNKPATSPLLLTEREVLVLASHPQIWIDADVFEQLLARAHTTSDQGERERLLEEAASLYGGLFLPEDRKNEWTRVRRESLQRSWIGLLLDLTDLRIGRDALNSAVETLDRLLTFDSTNEAAVQRLIRVLMQLGRRGEALRAYQNLEKALKKDYGITPLPETRALHDALRAGSDKLPSATATASGTTTVRDAGTHSPEGSHEQGRAGSLGDGQPVVQIGRTHQSPLVGREREIELLRALVNTTENAVRFRLSSQKRSALTSLDPQRRPHCVLLLGDVGIGKTRLAEEVSRDAKRRGWAVAWSRVYAQEGTIPYRLWTDVLRNAMEQCVWRRQEVSKRPFLFQPLTALLPELTSLLPQTAFEATLPPEREQLRLWEAAYELLNLVCESTPLLIALDDLQWSDSSSCELLAYLARRIAGLPIVIVGTCRDNELTANHPLRPMLTDLQRENALETAELDLLSDPQIETLVSHIPHVPEPLVTSIRDRAAGNPFFAEELARSVDSTLAGSGGHLMLPTATADADGENLPETIHAVLALRLARLSEPCQRLLSKGAVLGGAFKFEVINAMESSTPGSNEDIVLELLEEGLNSGMLTEEGTGTRITYHFWHPLLVDHLYMHLSAARRALLHRRAADVLRRTFKNREEEEAAAITNHLVKGGADADLVARYAEMAGDHAYSLSSYDKAEEYYRIALTHLDTHKEEWQRLAYILERLGECTRIRGKFEEARTFYEQALELHQKNSNKDASDYQQEAQVQALLWHEIGRTWYNTGKSSYAQKCYEHGENVLQDAGVIDGIAWANIRLQQSYVNWHEGNYEQARYVTHKALMLFEQVTQQQEQDSRISTVSAKLGNVGVDDVINLARAHVLLAAIDASDGQSGEALTHLNTALAIDEQYNRQREISIVCCNLGDVYLRKGQLELAQSFFRRSLNIAERIGDIPSVCVALGNIGVLSARLGNLGEAENWFKKCINLAIDTNDPVYVSIFSAYLSTALQEQGKLTEANKSLIKSLQVARSSQIEPCIGSSLIALGNTRINQATLQSNEMRGSDQSGYCKIFKRASRILQRALALQNIEAETRTEGQLLLAYVQLMLGETENALQLATKTLEEARQFELMWLIAKAQSILGSILSTQGAYDEGDKQFELAMRTFQKSEMRLEYAVTLQQYGEALLQREENRAREERRAVGYLREAEMLFGECGAGLYLQMVRQVLGRYEGVGRR